MAAAGAAEAGAAPALVHALSGLVMLAAAVDGKGLEEEGSPFANRQVAVLGEFLEKLLVAENGVRRPERLEVVAEEKLLPEIH
jgi:hypothetical protein